MRLKLYRDKRLKRIFLKNYIVFISFLIVFVAMLIFPFSKRMSTIYRNQLININNEYLFRVGDMVDSVVSEIESYMINISVKDEIATLILSDNESEYLKSAQTHLKFYKGINKYIHSVSVYNFETEKMITDSNVINRIDKNEYLFPTKEDETNFTVCAKNNKYPFVIRMVRCMRISGNKVAVIIDLDVERFSSWIESIDEEYVNQIFITTDSGEFVYGDKIKERFKKPIENVIIKHSDGTAMIEKEKFVISEKISEKTGLIYISMMPFEYYSETLKSYGEYIILIGLFSLIIGLFFAFFMTKSSVNHIDIILSEIDNKEIDNQRKIPIEIRCIVEDIRRVFKDREKMDSEIHSRMLLLKLAQAQALQTQINPHFLHNTLEMINWMAFGALGKENEISKCITELSEMFRKGLETDEYIVSLKDETEHAIAYCKLLEVRFENSIKISFDIPGELLYNYTLKFILQPLIENAVYHGIRPKGGSGNIYVRAYKNDNELIISVADDGKGMDNIMLEKTEKELKKGVGNLDEQIRELIKRWNVEDAENNLTPMANSWWLGREKRDVGIGIKNINNRIKMIFGENYGLDIIRNEYGGITAKVRLPVIKN